MLEYNKLLEKAKEAYKNCVTDAEKRRFESIFPELKQIDFVSIQNNLYQMLYKEVKIGTFDKYGLDSSETLKWVKNAGQWKPTEEQMRALEHFVRSIGESGYSSHYNTNIKLIYSLLDDLKKL